MKPEHTSPQVAKLAGRMLKACEKADDSTEAWIVWPAVKLGTVRDLKAVFTALTQARDKPKRKTK